MKIISKSARQTLSIGRIICGNLQPSDIVCLFGQLGSGKTVLAKGIAWGLGIKKDKVASPSFVLIREYAQGKIPLYHFDLYRLNNPQDILCLGYEEYLYAQGICVIEWAERLKYLLPKEFLKIELSLKPDKQRELKFSACGMRYQKLMEKISEDIRH
jgi:tRNA threonylcarbamoyladenosine biosynthesis protein TsaE